MSIQVKKNPLPSSFLEVIGSRPVRAANVMDDELPLKGRNFANKLSLRALAVDSSFFCRVILDCCGTAINCSD